MTERPADRWMDLLPRDNLAPLEVQPYERKPSQIHFPSFCVGLAVGLIGGLIGVLAQLFTGI